MDSQGQYDSSGQFTLDAARQRSLLRDFGLQDPAQAILLAVQGLVQSGAEAIALRPKPTRLRLELQAEGFDPGKLPHSLQRALALWEGGEPGRWEQNRSFWRLEVRRQVPAAQPPQERRLLRQFCRFCPVPLKLDGQIVQPAHWSAPRPGRSQGLHKDFHLAEWYWDRGDGPGLSLLRPDLDRPAVRNGEWTFWREAEAEVTALHWSLPWTVAGQVARQRPGYGLRAGAVVVLRAETGLPARALAVHQGVLVSDAPLDWPELPGLCLIFDASHLAVDVSGLRLVDSLALQGFLHEARQRIQDWVQERLPLWRFDSRWGGANSWQTRKEVGAWLGAWGISMLSGASGLVPLPLLALPWIVWHHGSRRKLQEHWQRRLSELRQQ